MTKSLCLVSRTALLVSVVAIWNVWTASSTVEAASENLEVTVSVLADCTLETSPVAFGNYGSNRATPLSGTGTITYTCSPDLGILIELDSGANADGAQRRMASTNSPVQHLTYELYQDNGGDVWGESAQGMEIESTSGNATELTVYGVVDELQNVSADDYSDTVGVVLTIL